MKDENIEDQDSSNPDEDVDLENNEDDADIKNSEGEDADKLKEELEKAKKIAENQRIRAEKAESGLKKLKEEAPKTSGVAPKNEYSLQDIRALGDVHDEDVDDVVDYAKFKGISITEAKKTSFIKGLLKDKTEIRESADATQTGGRKGSPKVSDESLLEKAAKGDDLTEDEIARAARARIKQKKNKK